MKTRLLLFGASIVLMVLSQVEGWAQQKYQPKANEELYGTWVNQATSGRLISFSGGWKEYQNASDKVPIWEGTELIDSKWIDAEGNTWYKTFCSITSERDKGMKFQELHKLSKSGTVKESMRTRVPEFDSIYFPAKIDPNNDDYAIYHRAEMPLQD